MRPSQTNYPAKIKSGMRRRLSTVRILVSIFACLQSSVVLVRAQSSLHRLDSILTLNYLKGDIDTAYVMRPATKWTITARMNVSGAKIEAEGIDRSAMAPGSSNNGQHFKSEMKANRKTTISMGVSYLGLSLSASLNPAKLMGKYRDFELNFNSYSRRISYPAAFSQSYIQRRSAGSFLLAASAMGQHATLDWDDLW